jgi:Zn-dependent M32 family carboxypeptidase
MIKRDTQTTHNRAVPPWEIPILEMIFGEGNVEQTGIFEEVVNTGPNGEEPRDYPEATEEYDRLVQRYKKDPETKLEIVAEVYGQSRKGIKALAEAIEEARQSDEDAVFAMQKRRERRHAVNMRRFANDPLLA